MEQLQVTTNQTPIEIALGVDENDMTTARKLYEYLELSKGQFSRWAKSNIVENPFATEGEDYWGFDIYVEGNIVRDFRLTAHFAKKLSVKGNSAKAEAAREYFTRIEEKTKQDLIDRTQLSPQMQLMNMLVENMSRQELEQKRQAVLLDQQSTRLGELEATQKVVVDTFKKDPDKTFRVWANGCINTIVESSAFHRDSAKKDKYHMAWSESYERLNQKRGCRLQARVDHEKERAVRAGASREDVRAINKLSIIEKDKTLRPIYETVLKEMMLAYCVGA